MFVRLYVLVGLVKLTAKGGDKEALNAIHEALNGGEDFGRNLDRIVRKRMQKLKNADVRDRLASVSAFGDVEAKVRGKGVDARVMDLADLPLSHAGLSADDLSSLIYLAKYMRKVAPSVGRA